MPHFHTLEAATPDAPPVITFDLENVKVITADSHVIEVKEVTLVSRDKANARKRAATDAAGCRKHRFT
jgi:hypothetical protein